MSKQILKLARACVDSGDWAGVEMNSRKALTIDPQSYLATLYIGKCLFNLQNYEESEKAYRQAIEIEVQERQKKSRKENPATWQGLLQLYDALKQIDKYMDTAVRLASIFQEQEDRLKCVAVIDKLIPFVKENGSKAQYKKALQVLLPGSPVFEYLDGLIPRPDQTYLTLTEIIEAEEKEKINKEIANRRSRLGAVLGQVASDVQREVWGASPLEDFYQNILDWSDDETLRRKIDCKLLQRGYDKLMVLPKEGKLGQRIKVETWARGLVILKYPFELAWKIVVEWKDCESIGDHDVNLLREYIRFFPENGLTLTLKAYLDSPLSPFPVEIDNPEDSEGDRKDANESDIADTILDEMIGGLEKNPLSVLCHRVLADYYLLLDEYENAVDTSRAANKLIVEELLRTGLSFQKNRDALTVTLGTALIHYQAPKHHSEAQSLFEKVLRHNPSNGNALVGLGLILQEQGDYPGATDFLQRALVRDPGNVRIMSEAAWCNVLQCNYDIGKQGLESCLEKITGVDPRSRDLKAQILWKIGTCIWSADEEARSNRTGPYAYFISALQNSQNFAPAYTSLGCFYADIMNDSARAKKCFQRAFELSAGEVEAAERLARSFAETKEWELVEIVARRVAEADKKRSIPGKGISWPQSAIGVVELNNQNYHLAIPSFQAALRASPNDFHSWIGLGEAYASSGRYTAALKVFNRAEQLDGSNWFARYMLANVRRELGELELACDGYREVLALKENELGVLVALSETLLAMAWKCLEKGYYGRSIDSAVECFKAAESVLEKRSDAFNLWKTIGDACMIFSWVQSLAHKFPVEKVLQLLTYDFETSEFDIMANVDEVGSSFIEKVKEGNTDPVKVCVYMGVLAYKRAIYTTAEDRHAHAVSWYNLGTAEYRAYITLQRDLKHRMAAIRCFKRTIKLEPANHEFWNALGLATAELNVKVAQHSLVRALYINDKNARVWTNLGTLYALQGDYQLANEAFSKAQSTDPEYALAWVGQGLIASLIGEVHEAQELFQHAFEISDQALTPTKQQFVTATFDTLVKTRSEPTLTSILTPLFALGKLEAQFLHLPHSLHLRSLFDERVHDFTSACDKLQQVCAIYEEKYELTKSEEDLIKYVQSKADLARMHLGIHRYEDAIEHVSIALNLSNDIEKLRIFRLSAHLTAGLAHYYTQRMDESLEMFKAALSESDENPDVVCLLSQVLWAKGGEQEREVAREQLFASIEENPDHLGSILLLGTIGIMDKSSEVADAVVDDLRSFQARVDLPRKTREKIDNLLVAIAQLTSDGHRESNATAVAANAVFMRPLSSENWSRLAEVGNNRFSAEAALIVAQSSKDCDCVRLSKAYASVGKVGCDLRAIFLAPWMADGWDALYKDVKQPKKKQQKVRCKSGKLLKKQKKRKVRVGKT